MKEEQVWFKASTSVLSGPAKGLISEATVRNATAHFFFFFFLEVRYLRHEGGGRTSYYWTREGKSTQFAEFFPTRKEAEQYVLDSLAKAVDVREKNLLHARAQLADALETFRDKEGV